MSPSNYRVRRATLDDIGDLKAMWQSMNFPAVDLDKRLTEFQVVEGPEGKVVGAWGLQIEGRHGRIHSEAFQDFAVADAARPLFWQRIQSLTMNHGVVRLWTQEHAPFWTRNGFQPAGAAVLEKLPSAWDRSASNWLTLQLKDEEAIASLDKEFALFMESEKQRTSHALSQARTLKIIVTVIAFIVAIGIFAVAAWVFFAKRSGVPPSP